MRVGVTVPLAYGDIELDREKRRVARSGRPVDLGLRVDRGRLLRARNLDQAQVGPIGILAHELGVHGDKRLFGEPVDESLKVVRLGNQRMNTHESYGGFSGALAG